MPTADVEIIISGAGSGKHIFAKASWVGFYMAVGGMAELAA